MANTTGISASSEQIYANIQNSQKMAMEAKEHAGSWTVPLIGFHVPKGPFADKNKIAAMDNYLQYTLPQLMEFLQNRYKDDDNQG
jgi:hypothetical protein